MNKLAEIGAALLGGAFHHAEAIHGGDLSAIVRIELSDGREVIVKNGPAPKTEAAMLRAIAASGAPAPAVLAVSDEALVIELLPTGGSLSRAWASLGLVLARLHATSGARYGWPTDYAFGPVAIANGWTEDWPCFWAERRLLVHLAHLPSALARRVEALATDLPQPFAGATDTCASPRRSMGRQHINGWRPGQRIDRSGLLLWPCRGRPRNARLVRPTWRRVLRSLWVAGARP